MCIQVSTPAHVNRTVVCGRLEPYDVLAKLDASCHSTHRLAHEQANFWTAKVRGSSPKVCRFSCRGPVWLRLGRNGWVENRAIPDVRSSRFSS